MFNTTPFDGSALRFNDHKPKMHNLGYFYPGLEEVMRVCEFGETKYSKGNFMLGEDKPLSEYLDAALRHTLKASNSAFDSESGCYHAAHAVWNLLELLTRQRSLALKDDVTDVVPDYRVTAVEGHSKEKPPEL